MKGTIKSLEDEIIQAKSGRPPIKKKIVVVEYKKETFAIEYTGKERRYIIRELKINDNVDVEFKSSVFKKQSGIVINKHIGLTIKKQN